eukprot:scaffold20711_cov124-Isochrysis_galbana.AAC.2
MGRGRGSHRTAMDRGCPAAGVAASVQRVSLASGDSAGHPAALALAGGWLKSCVHYNSLRLSLENLGENVEPSYVRVHLDSLRADYG